MSALAITTTLFTAFDSASQQAQTAAREAARAKSIAALSEVKPVAKATQGVALQGAAKTGIPAAQPAPTRAAPDLQRVRRDMDAHTIDVRA